MKSHLGLVIMVLALATCGGCLKTMHMNVANGMFIWDFESTPATSYRIGSYGNVDGRSFDALYFDALPEEVPPTAEELATEIEVRLAELESAAAAAAPDDGDDVP